MARKPADIVARIAVRIPYGHQGLWEEIRQQRRFTIVSLMERVEANRTTVTGYLKRLELAGFIRPDDGGGWGLVNDQPQHPRLRRDGTPAAETGLGQEQMWRSMKMLSDFDARDLAAAATTDAVAVAATTAKSYLSQLYRAGYLLRVAVARRGRKGGLARYRLKPAMNTGPLAPQIQATDFVFDPNTRKVMGLMGPMGPEAVKS
jgi:hypothetical protein